MPSAPSTPTSAESSSSPDGTDGAAFEGVDWDRIDRRRRRVTVERAVLVFGLLALGVVFAVHHRLDRTYLVRQWIVGPEDWLLLASAVVIVAYGIVPLLRGRGRFVLAAVRGSWEAMASLVFLLGVVVAGFYSTFSSPYPDLTLDAYHPPVGFTAPNIGYGDCAGKTSGAPPNVECHGIWEHPLGTHRLGYEMTDLLVIGAQPTVYAVFVTLGLIVPLAVGFGVLAGYRGGLVDDVLMTVVDVQLTLPAMLVYLVAFMFVTDSIAVFLLAFGLLSWGGIARIVRSETLKRREEGYVLSARAIGAPPGYVIRRHVLPNVTNSILPATFHLIAILVLTEAGLSFLGFTPIDWSWGETIARGLEDHPPTDVWWTSTLPVIALSLTVVSCKLAGDHFRDALDPRGGERR